MNKIEDRMLRQFDPKPVIRIDVKARVTERQQKIIDVFAETDVLEREALLAKFFNIIKRDTNLYVMIVARFFSDKKE